MLTRARLACNGTIVNDTEMGEVIQLQGDQRKDVQEFLVDKKEGLELDAKTIKVCFPTCSITSVVMLTSRAGSRVLDLVNNAPDSIPFQWTDRSSFSKAKSFTSYLLLLVWCVASESVRWGVSRYPLSALVGTRETSLSSEWMRQLRMLLCDVSARPVILYYGPRA